MPNPTEDEHGSDDGELYLQPINSNASRDELLEALKSSQLSVTKLLTENRKLQKTNSDLLANSSKKHCKGAEQDVLGYKLHAVTLAKKFLFTRALFIDTTMFRPKPPQPLVLGRREDSFSDDAAYRDTITVALYEEIPEKFHSLLDAQTYANFAKDFVHEHGDGRSTLISLIQRTLPVILKGLDIDSDILTMADADHRNNPALKGLLQFPNERKATLYAPVLFPGITQNMNELFTGPIFMKVHRLMYFGPKSLVPGKKPASNSNGMKMRLRGVMESLMAAAGILTRFVLSPDTEWAATGSISGTDWEADYRAYHKLLTCHRHLAQEDLQKEGDDDDNLDSKAEEAIVDAIRRFELGTDPTSDLDDTNAPIDGGATAGNITPPTEISTPPCRDSCRRRGNRNTGAGAHGGGAAKKDGVATRRSTRKS
ncbi:hypothetical protein B0H17DRAFT_1191558 [Mycena rosella]|uniref:Uncharacterized protein n=1 Tax=Mycena rosella TaxID=1033263 RepID=A0AAD7GYD2_MYCRO|nr:hypothetical protein B0H17DRAFT_1191558 [Mycena rosella]